MDRDPRVTRYVPGPWSKPAEHEAFVLQRMSRVYPKCMGYWSVFKRDAEGFLGWILLVPYDAFEGEVEIGWRFVRSSWGYGYATEAASQVLQHAFEGLGLGSVVADIDPQNHASIRVAEKLGMRHVGYRIVNRKSLSWYVVTNTEFFRAAHH